MGFLDLEVEEGLLGQRFAVPGRGYNNRGSLKHCNTSHKRSLSSLASIAPTKRMRSLTRLSVLCVWALFLPAVPTNLPFPPRHCLTRRSADFRHIHGIHLLPAAAGDITSCR
ncbi:hypothetical protein Bbelb_143210 [Branchiostoma belcheri]|nr:hypothetical protein Bbelb_143210 [Branchiostoma belcheri]